MTETKTFEITLSDFTPTFFGLLSSISKTNNPFYKKALEIAEENNIPESAISDTEIFFNDLGTTFKFSWNVDVESPLSEKKVILAYSGHLPSTENNQPFTTILIKINDTFYKSYLFDLEEFENDYILSDNVISFSKEEDFNNYFLSLDIDWSKRFKSTLTKMFQDYDLNFSSSQIDDFLSNRDVRIVLSEEDGESVTDTSPREIILDLAEDFIYPLNEELH